MENTDWCIPDEKGIIHIPDEHDDLVNRIAFQHKLHTISQCFCENEMYARMVFCAEEHFKKLYKPDLGVLGSNT